MSASDSYLDPYRDSLKKHGCDFRATLWASERSQRRRFEVLAQMGHLAGKRVLDAGCSRGDFAAYLIETGVEFDHYLGIDALPEIVAYARTRQLPRCDFVSGDFIADASVLHQGAPQVICISGSLNTMTDAQARQVLNSAWEAAGETLVFNFLSDRCGPEAPPQLPPVRRLNTMQLLDWALSRTSQVNFRQNYFTNGHDATIGMRKGH